MNKKLLVIGDASLPMSKGNKTMLDKLVELGYDVEYGTDHKIRGMEFDYVLIDELTCEDTGEHNEK